MAVKLLSGNDKLIYDSLFLFTDIDTKDIDQGNGCQNKTCFLFMFVKIIPYEFLFFFTKKKYVLLDTEFIFY